MQGFSAILDQIYEKLDRIPNFPETAQKALRLLQSEDINFQELEKVVKHDATITANFLKLVNSAAFGLRRKVNTLLQAFSLLGLNQIRFILIASCTAQYLNRPLKGYDLTPQEVWLHSLACGIMAEELAKRAGLSKPENLFTAALLHDLGKIVIDLFVEGELEEIKKTVRENPHMTFAQAEWLILGTEHALVGAELLKRWDFPKEVHFAVRAHHDESLMTQTKVAALTALSNAVVNLTGIGAGTDAFFYNIPEGLLEAAGISETDLIPAIVEGFKRIEALKSSLLE